MKNETIESAEQEIDNILGDVLDTMEEAKAEPNIIVEEGKPRVNIEKFDKLMEAFDIGEGNMSENIDSFKKDTMQSLKELKTVKETITLDTEMVERIDTAIVSAVNMDEMVDDHVFVKEALKENISNTRVVLAKLSEEISTADMDQLNGQVTEAFASISKAHMQNMKLLLDSHSIMAKTQVDIKKLQNDLKTLNDQDNSEGGTTNNTQINFVGTPADLLASLKTKD